jgi:hypothetical protein
MASYDLDTPQISVVDIQDDDNHSPLDDYTFPSISPPMRNQRSPSDTHDFLPPPTLRLTNCRVGFPTSRASDASSSHSPPSPTQSARGHSLGSTVRLRDNNPEEHVGLSSSGLITPPTRGRCRKGRTVPVSSIGTDRDVNGSSSLGLSPVRPSQGSETSRPSSVTSFFKRIVRCVLIRRLATLKWVLT